MSTTLAANGAILQGDGTVYQPTTTPNLLEGTAYSFADEAPADADVAASSVQLWVDETNGYLHFRLKYADGTVKDAKVTLDTAALSATQLKLGPVGTVAIQDATGRLGMGTDAPESYLHLVGGSGLRLGLSSGLQCSVYNTAYSYSAYGTLTNYPVGIHVNNVLRALFTTDNAFALAKASAEPTPQASYAGLYSLLVGGTTELFAQDSAGNEQQLTPHDPATGETYVRTRNRFTGKEQIIWTERIARVLEALADAAGIKHEPLIEESWAPEPQRADWASTQEQARAQSEGHAAAWEALPDGERQKTPRPEPHERQPEPAYFAAHRKAQKETA